MLPRRGTTRRGTRRFPPLTRIFCGEALWPFDPDFWERSLVEAATDVEALVSPFSEGLTIGAALKKCLPQGLEKPCNGAILAYNCKYDPEESAPHAPATFLGLV